MKTTLLQNIYNPTDLRQLDEAQLPQVAQELRDFIIDIVAVKEGHLGASLGVIELTIALHYVFNTPEDLLIWDVGHQAYGHKILTERREIFHTNRQLNGISGFPKRSESVYDAFGVGHSSTSISAALGMAIASNLKGDFDKQHIAVIGDASITAMCCLSKSPFKSKAIAMPKAAEIEVEEWPTPKASMHTFAALWKTRNPVQLSVGMENFSSFGQYFYGRRLDDLHPK